MALNVWFNISSSDQPLDVSGVDWLEFSEGNDTLIFSNGSTEVIDGADIPSQSELTSAGVVLTGSEIVIPLYLIADLSEDELQEVHLMGNIDAQYVMAFDFDSGTASEPVLEFWDDNTLDSVDSIILGSGTPSQSFIRGITTTTDPSGADWVGSRLAGSSAGNFLYLNDENGPLTVADTLYCQLKVVIPASQTTGFSANPVWCVKWLEN